MTGFAYDVEPGQEAAFAAWLEQNIKAVSAFSLFSPSKDSVLPRLAAVADFSRA